MFNTHATPVNKGGEEAKVQEPEVGKVEQEAGFSKGVTPADLQVCDELGSAESTGKGGTIYKANPTKNMIIKVEIRRESGKLVPSNIWSQRVFRV